MEPLPEPSRPKKRTGASKYDFFKVKVWLGEDMDHYYVLSRFLICRMLTVTKIPYIKAVKIALETKKYLVDHNLQDVTQAQLESVLFSIIRSKGFDEQYIDCYRMVTQFYQQRQPLCIVICGSAWTGKSSIAQQLASRINIPNVMQTDVIYELLRAGGDSPLHSLPLWCRPRLADAALVTEFRREARVVRKGLDGDLVKTLSDGKPIILEGMHLDPDLLIPDFQCSGIIMLPARPPPAPRYLSPARHTAAAAAAAASQVPGDAVGAGAGAAASSSMSSSPGRLRGLGRSQSQRPFSAAAGAAGGGGRWAANRAARPPWASPVALSSSTAAAGAGCLVPAAASSAGAPEQQEQQPLEEQQEGADSLPQCLAASARASSSTKCITTNRLLPHDPDSNTVDTGAGASTHWMAAGSRVIGLSASHSFGSTEHSAQQCAGATRPTPFGALDAAAAATAADGHAAGSSTRAKQLQPLPWAQEEPSLDLSPAAAAAAALEPLAAAAGSGPVVMLDRLFTDAAAAEATALRQHRQQQQNKQEAREQAAREQAGLFSPVSCRSTDSDGVSGVSPCISQEHSTTEVVSRQPSCSSPALSQERSGASLVSQEPSAPELSPVREQQPHWQQAVAAEQWQLGQGSGVAGDEPSSRSACCCRDEQQQQQQEEHTLPVAAQRQHCSQTHQHQQQVQLGERTGTWGSSDAAAAAAESGFGAAAAGEACNQQGVTLDEQSVRGGSSLLQASCGEKRETQRSRRHAQNPAAGLPGEQHQSSLQAAGLQQQEAQAQPIAQAPAAAGASSSSSGSAVPAQQLAGSGQQGRDRVLKPLFVPILVYMDEADHALMAEEALPHYASTLGPAVAAAAAAAADKAATQRNGGGASAAADPLSAGTKGGSAGVGVNAQAAAAGGGAGSAAGPADDMGLPVNAEEALRRMRLLQEYMCAYEAQGLPVVRVSYGNFSEAVDKLHEYILQCIKVAMESSW